MKNLKLSFALIIAVLAVGVTFATKATAKGGALTQCFIYLTLTDGTNDFVIKDASTELTCSQVNTILATPGRQWVDFATLSQIYTTPIQQCPQGTVKFCCAFLVADDAGAPAGVPVLNLGEGNHKYRITDFICKPQ